LYLQGAAAGTGALAAYPPQNGSIFNIGVSSAGISYFNGLVDEVRISNLARSAGWLATEYNNQSNPTGFASLSSEWNDPAVITPPASRAVNAGQSVTFSVTASGTPAPSYQWQFNGANIAGATNAACTITPASSANNGLYSVIISNLAGAVTTTGVRLTVNPFQITSLEIQTNDVLITWTTTGGTTNVVQVTPNLAIAFTNLSPNNILPGAAAIVTNYLDLGGATNWPARFYRIKLAP
jgi:hypothetical protein